VPIHPSIQERIGDLAQMRMDICSKLPAEHPFQPPYIQPLQTIPADAEVEREQVVHDLTSLLHHHHHHLNLKCNSSIFARFIFNCFMCVYLCLYVINCLYVCFD